VAFSLIEALEARALLSASTLAKPVVAQLPNLLGEFDVTGSLAAGVPGLSLIVKSQKRSGAISGSLAADNGVTGQFTGTVNKKGAVHLALKGSSLKFSTQVVATLSGDALDGRYTSAIGRHHQAGTFSASRVVPGIAGTTGAVTVVAPPMDMSTGAWESNTQVRAFVEQQDLVLPQSVNLDISVPGTSPDTVDANLSPGTVRAGTVVNCYALHFDVVGSPSVANAIELTGSITIRERIIGLIVLSNSLTATNGILGITGDIYPYGSEYGLELNPAGGGTSDVVTLSPDRHTVTIDWRTANSADNIRIVTAAP